MIFYWINRVITGDTLMGLSIWLACTYAYLLAGCAKWPAWARAVYFVALSFCLMVLAHMIVDEIQIWWVTPLGEHMTIRR